MNDKKTVSFRISKNLIEHAEIYGYINLSEFIRVSCLKQKRYDEEILLDKLKIK